MTGVQTCALPIYTRDASDQGRIVAGDPSSIRPQDGQLITIAFGPKTDDIPKPPSEKNLDALSDVGTPTTTTSTTSTTVAPTTTTAAP